VRQVAVLRDRDIPAGIGQFGAIQTAALLVGVAVYPIDTRDSGEIEQGMAAFAPEPDGGLFVTQNTSALAHRKQLIALAERHRLPAVYASRVFVKDGGLLSYGANLSDNYRPAAGYVDRILKGAKRPTCRCRRRLGTSWSSISGRRRRSVWKSHRPCTPAPTR
jgi:putative tryptophan/tyrosine transport system substrate-binding protein